MTNGLIAVCAFGTSLALFWLSAIALVAENRHFTHRPELPGFRGQNVQRPDFSNYGLSEDQAPKIDLRDAEKPLRFRHTFHLAVRYSLRGKRHRF
jgi:hypothetical protein